MFVLGLLTCIVLRAFSAQAKVVTSFDECNDFFYKNTEPEMGAQTDGSIVVRKICQRYNGFFYYATLYSVSHRIPLYSAYTFVPGCSNPIAKPKKWHFEPQISGHTTEDMVLETSEDMRNLGLDVNTIRMNQAINSDYEDTGFDRGHLNPSSFQCDDSRKATFTLTNAAPMDPCFNRINWYKWESTLKGFLTGILNNDGGSVYIVTGTVPNADEWIPEGDSKRVSVPSHIWTAVCYIHLDQRKSLSFGYMGKNQQAEPDISLMSVSDLNTQLSELYSELLGTSWSVKIFVDDCFGDNNKLSKVQKQFMNKIKLPGNQRIQMSPGDQNMINLLKRGQNSDSKSSSSTKKVKMSTFRAELVFDSMSTFYDVTEKMKIFDESACLIKPLVMSTGHDELRKREASKGSDAVQCMLVPEKQSTSADGSPCSSFSDSIESCQCNSGGKTKSCCSTPCLYRDKLNSYRCYSGQTLIECSPRYSLMTYTGQRCLDDHPCATYGEDYYWCKTGHGYKEWNYCSPPLRKSKAENGQYCRSNNACANYGSKQWFRWCYTDDGKHYECCTSDDCFSTVTDKTCRPDHKCGYYGYSYLWCYTDEKKNWAKCCKDCSP